MNLKTIHANDISNETYCGIYISDKITSFDVSLSGNINKVTCKRCLKVAFKG